VPGWAAVAWAAVKVWEEEAVAVEAVGCKEPPAA
jgi:hypothetical protein